MDLRKYHSRAKASAALRDVLLATYLFAAAFSLLAYGARFYWLFDLLSHFRVVYALVLTAAAMHFLLGKSRALALIALMLACGDWCWAMPYVARQAVPQVEATFRVGQLNVHTANRRSDLVLAEVLKWNADLVVFTEVDSWWIGEFKQLNARYPHSMVEPRDDNFGIAVYSKHQLGDGRKVRLGRGVPAIASSVEIAGRRIQILGAHFVPPMSARATAERNRELEEFEELLLPPGNSAIVLGDFNLTAFSPYFRDFLHRTGLQDSSRYQGWQPSWPTDFLVPLLIIDHCLYSSDLVLVHRYRGQPVGSDHLPIFADFAASLTPSISPGQ